jgi:PAS domain S-box-containing protein
MPLRIVNSPDLREFSPAGRRTSTLRACIAVCAGYCMTGMAGLWLLNRIVTPVFAAVAPTLGVPWLAVGVGVGGLLVYGVRAWPGVFAGSCITWAIIQGDAWGPVLIDSVGETLSIVLIARLLCAWRYQPSLPRYQDALILIAAAAIGRLLSSGIDVVNAIVAPWLDMRPTAPAILAAAGVVRIGNSLTLSPAILTMGGRWWANSAAGIILVVPLLSFLAPGGTRRRTGSRGEFFLWIVAVLVWACAALDVSDSALRVPLLAVALALVVWAALRFGVGFASSGTLAMSMTATVGFGLQLGTFAGIEGRERIEIAWGFIGLLAGAGLFLTALLSHLERTERRLAALLERSRRFALAHPSAMWVEDLATGRIVLASAAAVRLYGYSEAALLRLNRQDLTVEHQPVTAGADSATDGATRFSVGTHRTASGRDIPVETTSTDIAVDGAMLRVHMVAVIGERNDLRLAVLNATDLERQRLGQQIRDGLGPILTRLEQAGDELLAAVGRDSAVVRDRVTAIERDAVAATTVCRQLSRGASPIHFVSGDLMEALRHLPQDLAVSGGPKILVDIRAFAAAQLPLERCEHLYGVARDAVRTALLRPNVRTVKVVVDVTTTALRVTVEDDGTPVPNDQDPRSSEFSAMRVRAAAAHARLESGLGDGNGNRLRIECRQIVDAAEPAADAAISDATPVEGPNAKIPTEVPAQRAGHAHRDWAHGLLLLLAYAAAGAIGLRFLQMMGTREVSFVPPLALPWVANGIAVVGLLLGGRRLAPAVFLASVAVWRGLAHDPWITVCVDAVGEALCAVLVVDLLNRWGFRRSFDSFRDLALLVVAAAAGRTLASVADILALHLTIALAPGSLTPDTSFGDVPGADQLFKLTALETTSLRRWWVNGLAGITLVVPVVAPLSRQLWRQLERRWREAALLAMFLGFTAIAIAGGPPTSWRLVVLALAIVVVAWSSVRFGVAVASAATLVLSLAATFGYAFGRGPVATLNEAEGAAALWGFIGLLGATGLFLTTVIAEYEKTLRNLEANRKRFETIFEADPTPLFAYGGATGRMTMVNAAAIRTYGYSRAQFLELTPADLGADSMPPAVSPPVETTSGTAAISSVHRTRTGHAFEVEQIVVPVNLGEETENLCIVVDVTERNELRRRLLETADVERRRLAHDLHDGLGQVLTGLSLGASTLRRVVERGDTPNATTAEFVIEAIHEARRSCEQIVQGLSPLTATGGDLLVALRDLPLQIPPESRGRLEVELRADSEVAVPLPIREHLYQIARECVNNALKHSNATRIRVLATIASDFITLVVEDNGVGFDPAAEQSGGVGLKSLALRAEAALGRFSVKRRELGGTAIFCRCPQQAVLMRAYESGTR